MKPARIKAERHRIDIGGNNLGAAGDRGVRRRNEGDRLGDCAAAAAEARGQTRDVQRRGAARHGHREARANIFGERRLEALDGRALGEIIAAQHRDHGFDILRSNALASVAQERLADCLSCFLDGLFRGRHQAITSRASVRSARTVVVIAHVRKFLQSAACRA